MAEPFETRTRVIRTEERVRESGTDLSGNVLSTLPVKPQERYKFIRTIGFGGMKTVLLVADQDTGREIAMAIIPDFRDRPASTLERFVREAKLTARLEHPNIIPVHDLGVDQSGSPYFTMKYLRGSSLARVLGRLQRDEPEAVVQFGISRLLQIYIRICNAVEFAHSQLVCHLDLKPDNVNVGDYGEVLVLDWGLAHLLDGSIPDDAGSGRGTPGFMAPEQVQPIENYPVGTRSDIYSLGAILYGMLALTPPLGNLPMEEIFRRTLSGEIPPPSAVAPAGRTVSPALEAICLKAMALNPDDRYQNVAELREDIFAFQTGYVPKAENASPLKHAGLFIGRNMRVLLVFLTILLLVLLAALTYHYYHAIY